MKVQTIAIFAGLGLVDCMGGGQEPAPAQPEPTASTGDEAWLGEAPRDQEQYGEPMTQPRDPDQLAEQGPMGERTYPTEPTPYGEQAEPFGEPEEPSPFAQRDPFAQPGQQTTEGGDLQARIEEALRTAPSVEDDQITVRVEGSRVHLSGVVDSPSEIRIAHDVAYAVPGVDDVLTDELRVG